ncbi:hypothetical protein B0H11DRAFT_1979671 [Mycena galericulata]|nr:hypothetical protein B0H11DRAFT_1979671 [Mycena galericulata]
MDRAEDNESQNLRRVDDLWFTRDTIVIRAESTIFQVSRSILAARSAVFRDMIAFPQPVSDDTELIDGSPVVRLHDSASDVEVFLRAIFDSNYFLPAPSPVEFSVVLGILRLSHKYDVEFLYRRALQHLITDGWYTVEFDDPDPSRHIVRNHDIQQPLSLIAVSHEIGTLWLLPWAYHAALSSYKSADLLRFVDGPRRQHARTCLAAVPQFISASVATKQFLTQDFPCAAPAYCFSVRMTSLSEFFHEARYGLQMSPFGFWDEEDWDFVKGQGMCDACISAAKRHHREGLARFWQQLPIMFGLPKWEELHRMKRAAMGEDDDGDAVAQ